MVVFKSDDVPVRKLWPVFLMGLHYDARIVCILLLPLLLIGSIRRCNPFESVLSKRVIIWLVGIFAFVFCLAYSVDYFHFRYLSERLNAQILNYLDDENISLEMVWQSYPVVWMMIAILCFTAGILWVIGKFYQTVAASHVEIRRRNKVGWSLSCGLLFAIAIFGRVGQYPLRWSDAFSLGDDFEANMSLNPFQSFFSTLKFRTSTFDLRKARDYYSLMAEHLRVQRRDSTLLNYKRSCYGASVSLSEKPNIVLVICESFSAYKSSMWGNPLNTTPYFNQLSKNGVFFSRCFTPAFGTARGVWATVTGIPDVEMPKTASRNPRLVNQATLINDFAGYEKMYFIGGSASWANIRGLLMNNIRELHLYEEKDYKAPKVDVWGISDKNLFLEANNKMAAQTKPFFAIIQTADNHRPYTIPKKDQARFKNVSFPENTLKKYGFESDKELNAFRYTDYFFQQFIESARREKYFNNTIFVFVGDHGICGNAADMFPRSWSEEGLCCEHVPLLFYWPARLKPRVINNVSSQLDILPTIASMTGIPYQNATLGRNLFDSAALNDQDDMENCAFIIDHDERKIGLVTNKIYYTRSLVSGKQQVVSVINNEPVDTSTEQSEVDACRHLTEAYFETSRYLLFNNKKK